MFDSLKTMALAALLAVGVVAVAAPVAAQTNQPAEMFTAFAVNMSGVGPATSGTVVATKITLNKKTNQIELENYGQQPVTLSKVTAKPMKK